MSTSTDFRPYAVTTARINRQGNMEVFKGNVSTHYMNYAQCDLFLQGDDVQSVVESLPVSEREELDSGWTIHTHFISGEYFTV